MTVEEGVEGEVLVSTTIAPLAAGTTSGRRGRRADRRAERRVLERLDALSAQLAELHAIRDLLARAEAIVGAGWVQGAWFTVATTRGERAVTAYDLRLVRDRPVTGACLVGAVVQAGGGPGAVRSQTVQRSLDLTWHTLREDDDRPVAWCRAPQVRTLQVLDLTHWNDAPRRTQGDVVDLLGTAQRVAVTERDRRRAERAELVPSRAGFAVVSRRRRTSAC